MKELFYQCQVLDNNDPLMLGRIRGRRLTDNYNDIIASVADWNEEKDAWTERDPFLFMPLMPYYLYSVPKTDEMCLIMYMSPDDKFVNQFYIQSTFYSPTSTSFQYYEGGNKGMGTAIQIANPKPLKNQDGTYTDKEIHKGVFPEPGDNSLLGRGSSDVIVKEHEVLVRAGKFKGRTLQPNVVPTANQQRGFLQLSTFFGEKKKIGEKKITELVSEVVMVKYLIEYNILNPENSENKFTGTVVLYKLKPDISVNSENLKVNSEVSESLKSMVVSENFIGLSKTETVDYINGFIKNCNNNNTSRKGVKLFSDAEKFPIYYRPNNLMYNQMTASVKKSNSSNLRSTGVKFCQAGICIINIRILKDTGGLVLARSSEGNESDITQLYDNVVIQITNGLRDLGYDPVTLPTIDQLDDSIISPPTPQSELIQKNLDDIYKGVKLNPAISGGYELIYAKDKTGKPTNLKETIVDVYDFPRKQIGTYGALGSNNLFLLSHISAIPGKGKINFDDTLYGISQDKFESEVIPKTSSMVRGEELLELINLIVRFLLTHTHAYPGLPPIPITQDGSKATDILKELQNAVNKILNTNIRLN